MSPKLAIYLFSGVFLRTIGVLGILVLLYVSIDFVETSAAIEKGAKILLVTYHYKLPLVIGHVLALSVTIGLLLGFSNLKVSGEWDALLAAGISPMRLSIPLMGTPFLFTIVGGSLFGTLAPAAYAKYESKLEIGEMEASSYWTNGEIIAQREFLGIPGQVLLVERTDQGLVTQWVVLEEDTGLALLSWQSETGWAQKSYRYQGTIPSQIQSPSVGFGGLFGASISSERLQMLAEKLELGGVSTYRIRSEIALRRALVAACFFLPWVSLLIGMKIRKARPAPMTAFGLGICTFYWCILMVAWAGVMSGMWPVTVIAPGIGIVLGTIGVFLTIRFVIPLRLR